MIFTPTRFQSVFLIGIEKKADGRGFFARTWCRKEFEAAGLQTAFLQSNVAFSTSRGTLRGLHYQEGSYAETKLVRCTKGALFDVVVDLRPHSPTCRQWLGTELRADDFTMIYVPEGFAHGYLTLEDNTEICYQVSQWYFPEAERGIRFNDPFFGIQWPADINVISEKDLNWKDYRP